MTNIYKLYFFNLYIVKYIFFNIGLIFLNLLFIVIDNKLFATLTRKI